MFSNLDLAFMQEAIELAKEAELNGEVPVGAVITLDNKIIGRGFNQVISLNDVTAHAEMQAFTSASDYIGGKYLKDCTLYVTLEPCVMCAGASYWTQISRIVVGARDLKTGFSSLKKDILHPKTVIEFGVLENESKKLLHSFFEQKRK